MCGDFSTDVRIRCRVLPRRLVYTSSVRWPQAECVSSAHELPRQRKSLGRTLHSLLLLLLAGLLCASPRITARYSRLTRRAPLDPT